MATATLEKTEVDEEVTVSPSAEPIIQLSNCRLVFQGAEAVSGSRPGASLVGA